MAFMVPEIGHGIFYYVENTYGEGTNVPSDVVPSKPKLRDFKDYIEGEPASFEKQVGWWAHLTAHGYMDQTDWAGPFKTEAEAMEYLKETYEVDEQGEPLGEVRGKSSLNDAERSQWIDNDEGLYNWWKSSRQSKSAFIKENRSEIDEGIRRVLEPKAMPDWRKYAGWSRGKAKPTRLDIRHGARIEIIVGNVGTVFDEYAVSGSNVASSAFFAYEMYVDRSVSGVGRSAGEDVVMLVDGEVYKEHRGPSTEGLVRGKTLKHGQLQGKKKS